MKDTNESVPLVRKLYAIRDDRMKQFLPPVLLENDAVATRMFGDVVGRKDANNLVANHPEDFSLWYIGDIDLCTGAVVQDTDAIGIICRASDFVVSEG